jgi:terminase small subunit-like protein
MEECRSSAAAALRELEVRRADFWFWVTNKATPSQRRRYNNAVAARAHSLIDETIDLADGATTRDEALRAKIQINARWQAASKYDPQSFGEGPLSDQRRAVNVVLIDAAMLARIQDRDEEKLLAAAQKPKKLSPSRSRGR